MSTTAQAVFDKSMALMDTIDETGHTTNDDTLEYQNRALYIINMIQQELYRYSDTYTATARARSVCTEVSQYTDTVRVDDYLARVIMPYGLAYHLLISEDPATANVFLQRYQELVAAQASAIPSESEDITNLYGGIEYMTGGEYI